MTAAVAALVGFSTSMQAVPITGTVHMSGVVTFDTADLATATSATFSNPAGLVSSGTGSYAAPAVLPGQTVNFFPFTFAATGPQVVAPLWSFLDAVNGWTYSFNLANITAITRTDSTDLNIAGLGTVTITGPGSTYDTTGANWAFTVSDTSGGKSGDFVFGFSSSDTAAVPDGGTTMILFGAALTGLGLLRKKLMA